MLTLQVHRPLLSAKWGAFQKKMLMRISNKRDLLEEVKTKLLSQGFKITGQEYSQVWGGSLLIDESQAADFAKVYFKDLDQVYLYDANSNLPLKPKILLVSPNRSISWQYHLRRAEVWQIILGEVGVVMNTNDEESEMSIKNSGDFIYLQPGVRHRLVGLKDWGVIAQIWQHVDASNPSDENDIIRLQIND